MNKDKNKEFPIVKILVCLTILSVLALVFFIGYGLTIHLWENHSPLATRSKAETNTLLLDPDQKLINASMTGNKIVVITRKMLVTDKPETYTLYQFGDGASGPIKDRNWGKSAEIWVIESKSSQNHSSDVDNRYLHKR